MKINYQIRPEPWLRLNYNPQYKEGDLVTCLPGYTNNGGEDAPRRGRKGGAGYVEGKVCMIESLESLEKENLPTTIIWPRYTGIDDAGGIYTFATRPATEEEIKEYRKNNP